MDFKNPADNKASLLVRLPNGQFMAYEKACTHEQVSVHYDPASTHWYAQHMDQSLIPRALALCFGDRQRGPWPR